MRATWQHCYQMCSYYCSTPLSCIYLASWILGVVIHYPFSSCIMSFWTHQRAKSKKHRDSAISTSKWYIYAQLRSPDFILDPASPQTLWLQATTHIDLFTMGSSNAKTRVFIFISQIQRQPLACNFSSGILLPTVIRNVFLNKQWGLVSHCG